MLGDAFPELPGETSPPAKRKSLVQCAVIPDRVPKTLFPFSRCMREELEACRKDIGPYKKDPRYPRMSGLNSFYTPLNEKGVTNKMTKLMPSLEECALGVFKCPSKGLPVTYKAVNHNELLREVRGMCWISSYQDWALRGVGNAVEAAVKLNESGIAGDRIKLDELLTKTQQLVQSLGVSWTDKNKVLCRHLSTLTLAQRDVLLKEAPQFMRESELSSLRSQSLYTDDVFDSKVGVLDFENKMASRMSEDSLSALAKASFKKPYQQNAPSFQKQAHSTPQKGGGGGQSTAQQKQQINQASVDFVNNQQNASGYNASSNYSNYKNKRQNKSRGGGGGSNRGGRGGRGR